MLHKMVRGFLVLAVGVSLVSAGGVVPRHAKASVAPRDMHATMTAAAHHDRGDHDPASAPARHDRPPHDHAAECDETGKHSHGPATPEQNCCVVSCSAIASVSIAVQFRHDVPKSRFELPLISGLTLSSLAIIEPPPR